MVARAGSRRVLHAARGRRHRLDPRRHPGVLDLPGWDQAEGVLTIEAAHGAAGVVPRDAHLGRDRARLGRPDSARVDGATLDGLPGGDGRVSFTVADVPTDQDLRVELGPGLEPRTHDVRGRLLRLLDRAQWSYEAKAEVWRAVENGAPPGQVLAELQALGVPPRCWARSPSCSRHGPDVAPVPDAEGFDVYTVVVLRAPGPQAARDAGGGAATRSRGTPARAPTARSSGPGRGRRQRPVRRARPRRPVDCAACRSPSACDTAEAARLPQGDPPCRRGGLTYDVLESVRSGAGSLQRPPARRPPGRRGPPCDAPTGLELARTSRRSVPAVGCLRLSAAGATMASAVQDPERPGRTIDAETELRTTTTAAQRGRGARLRPADLLQDRPTGRRRRGARMDGRPATPTLTRSCRSPRSVPSSTRALLRGGSSFTLEPGGQVELSSAPARDLATLRRTT